MSTELELREKLGEALVRENNLIVENAKLQELLRGIGANRYWEARWRDADKEGVRLRAALEKILAIETEDVLTDDRYEVACGIAKAALTNDPGTLKEFGDWRRNHRPLTNEQKS